MKEHPMWETACSTKEENQIAILEIGVVREQAEKQIRTSKIKILQVVMHRQVRNLADQIERHVDNLEVLRRREIKQPSDPVVRRVELKECRHAAESRQILK